VRSGRSYKEISYIIYGWISGYYIGITIKPGMIIKKYEIAAFLVFASNYDILVISEHLKNIAYKPALDIFN